MSSGRVRAGRSAGHSNPTIAQSSFARSDAFSSNYAPLFGRLLTPLVNGIRVFGPFTPAWATSLRLILIDGEGLGHTPTVRRRCRLTCTKRVEQVDAVLLVDNATQPMQAAPISAMKMLASSGNGGKFFFLFTHFDLVKGPNMPTFADREAVRPGVRRERPEVDRGATRAARRADPRRRRIDARLYFVGGIHETLRRGEEGR